MTSIRSVMCEVNLVKVQCVTVKLLHIMSNNSEVNNCITIKVHKKCVKAIFFQNECCNITSIRSVMCEVHLVKYSVLQ